MMHEMTDADMLRAAPRVIAIRFFQLDSGMKLEVESKTTWGRGPKLYEGAFAGLDGSAEAARKAFESFVEQVKADLDNEVDEAMAGRKE